jgi:tetratricopeptide (TPR) repeat protein
VSDFGLAKWLDASSDVTRTLTIFGTPGYIAPEQARGPAANLIPAADVYSLGAILFDLFTGRPPFLGEHALAVIQQVSEKPAPKLRSLAPALDRDLETICARCLEREPSARYHSAGDLAEDLERWLEGRSIIARPVSTPIRIWRWSRRNPKLAASIAACAVLVAVAGTLQLQNRLAARADARAMHSIAVEPLLDLDTAGLDSKLSSDIASALQNELSKHGPARVTPVSGNAQMIASSGSSDQDAKSRWQGARTALQGTRRIQDGKLRLSLRLINASDGKVLYRRIVESDVSGKAADSAAKLTGANIYAILNIANLSSVESTEIDPGWRNESTREFLIAGRAVLERRTLGDMARAVELFEKAIKAEPRSALAHSYLAEAQFARSFFTGNLDYLSAADESAKEAVRLNSKIAETHNAMSEVLFQQGRFHESLEEAFTAYELVDSDDGRLPATVGFNLRMLGEPAKAVAWYRISKSSRPGMNELQVADSLVDLTDDEEAARSYNRASALFPELPEGWIGLCRLALLHKDFANARKICSENWTRYRDFVFSEEMAAQVEFFSRNFPEAEKLYQELASKDPNGGGSFYGAVSYQSALGRLRLAAGDERSGARILEEELKKEFEALRSAPQHPKILYRIAAIESSLGKVEPALEHLRTATTSAWLDYRSMRLDPRFDSISSDPRFKAIVDDTEAKIKELRRSTATLTPAN